ncbi:hypothetical protein ACJX0J_030951, partial [Zea mays]
EYTILDYTKKYTTYLNGIEAMIARAKPRASSEQREWMYNHVSLCCVGLKGGFIIYKNNKILIYYIKIFKYCFLKMYRYLELWRLHISVLREIEPSIHVRLDSIWSGILYHGRRILIADCTIPLRRNTITVQSLSILTKLNLGLFDLAKYRYILEVLMFLIYSKEKIMIGSMVVGILFSIFLQGWILQHTNITLAIAEVVYLLLNGDFLKAIILEWFIFGQVVTKIFLTLKFGNGHLGKFNQYFWHNLSAQFASGDLVPEAQTLLNITFIPLVLQKRARRWREPSPFCSPPKE